MPRSPLPEASRPRSTVLRGGRPRRVAIPDIPVWLTALVACSIVPIAPLGAEDDLDERPLTEQGYAGLALRDIADGHTVVSWIYPGPLDGEGIRSATLDLGRPDLVVAVDGRSLDRDGWQQYVRSRPPGSVVTLA